MTVDIAEIQSIKGLKPDMLAAIFDQYAPAIYKYTFRLCRDAVEADQIVGDVFCTLLEQLAAGKGPETNLRSYLYQVAYHLVVDHARARNRTTPLDENEPEQSESSVVLQAENRILLDALSSAIHNDLTDEQRQVIILRFQEGFSLQETAKIVGRKLNAVKALENRGVKKLRQILGHQFPGPAATQPATIKAHPSRSSTTVLARFSSLHHPSHSVRTAGTSAT
jgi:RNA polymerase sigma-70 factor (ECF subfamily)